MEGSSNGPSSKRTQKDLPVSPAGWQLSGSTWRMWISSTGVRPGTTPVIGIDCRSQLEDAGAGREPVIDFQVVVVESERGSAEGKRAPQVLCLLCSDCRWIGEASHPLGRRGAWCVEEMAARATVRPGRHVFPAPIISDCNAEWRPGVSRCQRQTPAEDSRAGAAREALYGLWLVVGCAEG